MRVLIVFEPMFGGTEKIARAIAGGMSVSAPAEAANVDNAPKDLDGVDLLVVGGPAHYATRSRTGIREWLDSLAALPGGLPVATFDTRVDKSRVLTGAASLGAAKRLRRLGCRVVTPAESFFVGTEPVDAGPGGLAGEAPACLTVHSGRCQRADVVDPQDRAVGLGSRPAREELPKVP